MFLQANKCTDLILLQAYLDYLWHKKRIAFAFLFSESKMGKYTSKITLQKEERERV